MYICHTLHTCTMQISVLFTDFCFFLTVISLRHFCHPALQTFLMAHPYQTFNWYSRGSRVFHLLRSIFQSSFWLYVLFYLSVTDNDRYCPLIKRVRTTSRAEGF